MEAATTTTGKKGGKKGGKKPPLKSVKPVPVKAAPAPAPIIEAEKLRDQARDAYGRFQRGWFDFARTVTMVHDTKIWTELGYDSFKEYALEEFKDLDYTVIVKFVKIMQGYFGKAIETRIKKYPNAQLPAWITCYQLTIAEKNFSREDLPKLRKEVLEGKITRTEMVEKVKENAPRFETPESDEDIDKEIEGATKSTTVDAEVVEDNGDEDLAKEMVVHAQALAENLPKLAKVGEASAHTVKLAEILYESVIDQGNNFIDHMEKLANEE